MTDCGPLIPACGLDNCDWWVFSTSKVSVVRVFWLCGASNAFETVVSGKSIQGKEWKVYLWAYTKKLHLLTYSLAQTCMCLNDLKTYGLITNDYCVA